MLSHKAVGLDLLDGQRRVLHDEDHTQPWCVHFQSVARGRHGYEHSGPAGSASSIAYSTFHPENLTVSAAVTGKQLLTDLSPAAAVATSVAEAQGQLFRPLLQGHRRMRYVHCAGSAVPTL